MIMMVMSTVAIGECILARWIWEVNVYDGAGMELDPIPIMHTMFLNPTHTNAAIITSIIKDYFSKWRSYIFDSLYM